MKQIDLEHVFFVKHENLTDFPEDALEKENSLRSHFLAEWNNGSEYGLVFYVA